MVFESKAVAKAVARKASNKSGILLPSEEKVGFIEECKLQRKKAIHEAETEHKVLPSGDSRQKVSQAKRALAEARVGLKIVVDPRSDHVLLGRACRAVRSAQPRTKSELVSIWKATVDESNYLLSINAPIISEQTRVLRRLEKADGMSEDIKNKSSFQALEALGREDYGQTWCNICLDLLGSSYPKMEEDKPSMIDVLYCAHLFLWVLP